MPAHTLAVLHTCQINTNTNIILMTRMVIRMDRFDMIWGLKSHQGGHDIFCLRIVIMGLRKVSTFPRIARKVAKIGHQDGQDV